MPTKLSTRLNLPTASDRLWFNQQPKDFFAEPTLYSEEYKLIRGKAIYPVEPERISHQKAELIRKYGNFHHSLWLNRVDLFLITLEGDWGERLFSCNLAGIDRKAHLRAQKLMAEQGTPEGATVEGQTYWELVKVLTADLVFTHEADIAFVSPFLHHLQTGELEPLVPLGELEGRSPLFTKDIVFSQLKQGMQPSDRRWMHTQSRLQEHDNIFDLHLNKYGFITEQ